MKHPHINQFDFCATFGDLMFHYYYILLLLEYTYNRLNYVTS